MSGDDMPFVAHAELAVQPFQDFHRWPGRTWILRRRQHLECTQLEPHRVAAGRLPTVLETQNLFPANLRVQRLGGRLGVFSQGDKAGDLVLHYWPIVPEQHAPTLTQLTRWKATQRARPKGISLRAIAREFGIARGTAPKHAYQDIQFQGPGTGADQVVGRRVSRNWSGRHRHSRCSAVPFRITSNLWENGSDIRTTNALGRIRGKSLRLVVIHATWAD